jgi:RimJ/RimL family protein N-acetyltransferase
MRTNSTKIIFLEGERVYLRPIGKEDVPLLLQWLNHPETRRYLAQLFPLTESAESEWVENLHKKQNENIVLGIMRTRDSKLIGVVGLHRIDWKDRRAVTGAVIGNSRFRGKGYGTEAKMLLLHYAFYTLNLRKICSSVLGFNTRSQAYNKKCGYKVEGVLRQHIYKDGEYCDEVQMAVFKEDWIPIWKCFEKTGKT